MSELYTYLLIAAVGGVGISVVEYLLKFNLVASFLRLVGGAKMALVKVEKAL